MKWIKKQYKRFVKNFFFSCNTKYFTLGIDIGLRLNYFGIWIYLGPLLFGYSCCSTRKEDR